MAHIILEGIYFLFFAMQNDLPILIFLN